MLFQWAELVVSSTYLTFVLAGSTPTQSTIDINI